MSKTLGGDKNVFKLFDRGRATSRRHNLQNEYLNKNE